MRVANFLRTQTPIQLTAFRAPAMTYFTDASTKGRVLFGQLPWVIGIIEAPNKRLLIGTAMRRGRTDDGQAVWSLKVRGADMPGRFIIEDGRFVGWLSYPNVLAAQDAFLVLRETLDARGLTVKLQTRDERIPYDWYGSTREPVMSRAL